MSPAERAAIRTDLADDSWHERRWSPTAWRTSLSAHRQLLARALDALDAAEARLAVATVVLREYADGYVGAMLARRTLAESLAESPPDRAAAPAGGAE